MIKPHRPFRFGVCAGDHFTRTELIELARQVEDLGYSTFSCSDHLNHVNAPLAPLVMLSVVAGVTSRVELQPLVLANDLRHPAMLAKEAATLDVLSEGRFALGIGAAWYPPDFKPAGLPFHKAPVRIKRLAESIKIIRGLHSGKPFSFAGEYFNIDGIEGLPLPARSPMPLMIGGLGPVMLGLAAREADTIALNLGLPFSYGEWQKGPTPYADVTDLKLDWIRKAAGERFDDLEIQTTVFFSDIANKMVGRTDKPDDQYAGCPHVLGGTVEECIETLLGWRERWGISYVTVLHTQTQAMAPVVKALAGK